MTEISVTVECFECNKKFDIDSCELNITCDDCVNLKENIDSKDLLDDFYENHTHVLDGEYLIGFKSEEEKLLFMQGVKYGYDHAGFVLMDYFGIECVQHYEKLSENFRKLEVKPNYNAEKEKEYE